MIASVSLPTVETATDRRNDQSSVAASEPGSAAGRSCQPGWLGRSEANAPGRIRAATEVRSGPRSPPTPRSR